MVLLLLLLAPSTCACGRGRLGQEEGGGGGSRAPGGGGGNLVELCTVAVGLDAARRCDAEICYGTLCACSSCVFGGLSAELQLKARLSSYVLRVCFVFFYG